MKYIFACLLSVLLVNASFAVPDVNNILKNSDQARGGGLPGIVWDIKLTSRDGTKVDEPQALVVKVVDEPSVAEALEPVRFKGPKILQVSRNMWLTKPGLSKPIPISPRQRMNGQASNGDIAATNYAADYEAQLNVDETSEGEECYVLDLSSKHKRTIYDKIRY
ncbi:MAG: outer membrane lipoprotein-sorting protein [Candidatus Nitrotoga sp. LAW]|nr:MAG: outer membrane lipoprotein-sorting protein [Candidatus Nitrotoga sp. LAW]